MPVYKANYNYNRSGILYPRGSQVSLTTEEAQPDVENGTLTLVGPDPEPKPDLKGKTSGGDKTPPGGEGAKP
jgi:hypothetical protein